MSRTVRPTWPDGPPDSDPTGRASGHFQPFKICEADGPLNLRGGPQFTQRACYRPKTVRGRPADGSPLSPPFRTGRSASSQRTVRPFLLNTLALTHEQPTYAPYTQSLYHSLALLEHASSCHLQIIAYIHDMLISQTSFAFM